MSDKNPCPFCGDDTEYLRFLDLCAERANEKNRENEVKILTDMCKLMDSLQIVRCRDCKYYMHSSWHRCDLYSIAHEVKPDGFCAWGEKRLQK